MTETKTIKLTEKSKEVFDYIKANGKVSITELTTATGRGARSINANVNDLVKKGLTERDKVEVEGEDKPVTYVSLTAKGETFVQPEE